MSIEKMREEFEAWARGHEVYEDDGERLPMDRLSGCYYEHVQTQAAWEAWQASRKSLVIELPNRFAEKYQDYYDDVEGGCFNEARYIDDLTAAIEAAGLGVKP
jgi:hypothetical protein